MELPYVLIVATAVIVSVYLALVTFFLGGLKKLLKEKPVAPDRQPLSVSVIVAARNEEHNIPALLNSLHCQEGIAGMMEVIISDDHSADRTAGRVIEFIAAHPSFPLTLVRPTPADTVTGKKAAITRAVERATGSLLLFTDADSLHGPGWIASMTAAFGNPGTHLVLGPVCYAGGGNRLQRIQELEFLGLMGVTAGSAFLGFPVMGNGANLACRRDTWLEAASRRDDMGLPSGDDQFLMMWVKKNSGGRPVVFRADPAATVTTAPAARWPDFFHQRIRWVSKSRRYRDGTVIVTGLVTWLAHLALLAGMISGFGSPGGWIVSWLLFMVKMAADRAVVIPMAHFFGKPLPAGDFLMAQLFQVVYVSLAGVLGPFLPYRWKGRRASASAIS
ncbi:MAG TPA: glycosyltransferase [Bacteroidales bacterium]|nr:glycosyltransferase [Bacteroidales bacterium]